MTIPATKTAATQRIILNLLMRTLLQQKHETDKKHHDTTVQHRAIDIMATLRLARRC
jgi:hypothetical protein